MHKSFINSLSILALIICSSLLLLNCSKSDEQRQFENEALSPPFTGITEMTAHCDQPENGQTDQNDWRASPRFSGLVNITCPAFPNPVYGQRFSIEIDLGFSIETVERLAFYAINPESTSDYPDLIPLLEETDLAAQDTYSLILPNNSGMSTSNVYRILIYDGRDNLISYGDVQVGGQ